MISIKSIIVVGIEILLASQVAAYKGWGSPGCTDSAAIQGPDCVQALHQFFQTSDVYTSVKNFTASDPQIYETCTVVLQTSTENCKVHEAYLRSGKSPMLEKMSGNRGGMDRLIEKCINNQMAGSVHIFDDPDFTSPTAIACGWTITISETIPQA